MNDSRLDSLHRFSIRSWWWEEWYETAVSHGARSCTKLHPPNLELLYAGIAGVRGIGALAREKFVVHEEMPMSKCEVLPETRSA
jgi:hypothetical protein